MINNFKQIKKLLEFRSDDDFYFLQILERKKDHKKGKINGTNNNSRLIKAYYIKSIEHLNFVMPEIIQLCEIFNARAGINLNRRSFKKIQLEHISKLVLQLRDGTYNKAHKAYNSVVGLHNNESDKKWIIDVDKLDTEIYDYEDYCELINSCQPKGYKIIAKIPSKSGYHIICNPFNLKEYNEDSRACSVHKNNPTNLYIP